jgi:hypothetical protein
MDYAQQLRLSPVTSRWAPGTTLLPAHNKYRDGGHDNEYFRNKPWNYPFDYFDSLPRPVTGVTQMIGHNNFNAYRKAGNKEKEK